MTRNSASKITSSFLQRLNADAVVSSLIFLFSLAVYSLTAVPQIVFEDSGEFAGAAHSLGVAHPPGYPLFVLLSRIAGWMPFERFAFRVNIGSAILGAIAAVLVFRAARAFAIRIEAATIAALCVSLSRTLWAQSSVVEVYSLNHVFVAGILALIGVFIVRRDYRSLALASFFSLLSVQNHYITVVAFYPIVVLLFFADRKIRLFQRLREIVVTLYLLVLCVSGYLFIPLRAAADPGVNWRDPQTWFVFLRMLRRTQMEEWENQLAFHLPTYLQHVTHFFLNIQAEFTIGAVFLMIIGLVLLWGQNRRRALLAVYLVLIQSLAILYYVRFYYNDMQLSITRVFFLGAYIVLGLLIGVALDVFMSERPGARTRTVVIAIGILLVSWQLAAHYHDNNDSHRDESPALARDASRVMRRDAVVLVSGILHVSPSMCFQNVEGSRGDIDIVNDHGSLNRRYLEKYVPDFSTFDVYPIEERLVRDEIVRRPIYTAYRRSFMFIHTGFFDLGPVYKLTASDGCDLSIWKGRSFRIDPSELVLLDYDTRMYYSFVALRRAECMMLHGRRFEADKMLGRLDIDQRQSPDIAIAIGDLYRQYGRDFTANAYYSQAAQNCSNFTLAWLRLGDVALSSGKVVEARMDFEKARASSPLLHEPVMRIAETSDTPHDAARAVALYRHELEQEPRSTVIRVDMGNAYDMMDQPVRAIKEYNNALLIDPGSALARVNMALLYIHREQPRTALRVIRQALLEFPDSSLCHYVAGVAFQKSRLYNDAIMEYRKVLEQEPDSPTAWRGLVTSLAAAGRAGEAKQAEADFRARMKRRGQGTHP